MTELRAALAEIQQRADAATEGPWRWAFPGSDSPSLMGVGGDENYSYEKTVLEAEHDGGCACRKACELEVTMSDADAEFIAAARSEVPRLTKSLNDVLELHKPERGWTTERCRDCEQNWPCLTYRAITAALAGES